ncbi:MAG: ubiquinone-dependent pyruvate dehydrogenase [Cyanobacteria bacterium SZAS LIN-2]|nr:ubiquinone-dependent pyruvate dehydrogenase [Cyanobacteria bacterium SZAS LIN-2]MBS2009874.1 ubiquinone-dependent pyruvate dehydrogenase [Cyanobacteria bacterium SZAS TMP-1]
MLTNTVAESLIDTLEMAHVRRVYGVAGDSLNGITDAIRRSKNIEWIALRHEETAAFAAGAEAHLTGRLAVCAGSCGPGNLHLINGLFDCQRNRVPVLAIAAQIPSHEIGSGFFQETHPERLFPECSHYCELVSQAEQMPRIAEIAVQTAISRSGVSVIVIPGDVALRRAPAGGRQNHFSYAKPALSPAKEQVEAIRKALQTGEKITILAGAGCADAHDQLVALAGKLKAPIVHALRGKEFVEYDNPFDVGMTGLLGSPSGYHAIMNCDTLLILGSDFPYQQFYPERCQIIQIDMRPEQIGRRTRVDIGVVGSAAETLDKLLPELSEKVDRSHLDGSLNAYRKDRADLEELADCRPGQTGIHPQYLTRLIDQVCSENAIFACDVGTPTIWAARYLKMNGQRRLLGSFNHGSMASALPQAIGAQLVHPNRQVVTLSGDGGLSMLMGDLASLKQHHLPVKIIVFNNGCLGFVEMEMKAAGFLDYGTTLENPDFRKLAEAFGIFGTRVESPEGVQPAIASALSHDGPAIVDVVINRQEISMPPSLQLQQVIGFNMYLMKAVLNGRGDEIIDLAKTNIFR